MRKVRVFTFNYTLDCGLMSVSGVKCFKFKMTWKDCNIIFNNKNIFKYYLYKYIYHHQQQWNHFGWAFLWFSSPIFLVSEIGVLIWNMCFIIYTQEIFTDMVLERLRQLHKGDNFINKFLLTIKFCQQYYYIWINYFQDHHLVTNIAGRAGLKNFGYLWDLYINWRFGSFLSFILKESLLQIFFWQNFLNFGGKYSK